MWIAVFLIIVQIALLLLVMPIRVGVQGYFALSSLSGGLDLKLFAICVVRLRLCVVDGKFELKINDKQIDKKKAQQNPQILKNVLTYLDGDNLLIYGNILAVFGGDESKNGAIICGVAEVLAKTIKTKLKKAKTKFFADFDRLRADIDFAFNTKINVMQAVEMLVGGKND
ncbi:MAG: hypothetical protein J5815_01515 [Clostridia bacterium]|nr:hypothetical protein [Clostridia bacterium]